MKKAVMYGGGNIGRGFIGMLFSQSGYEVAFIDVAKPVIEHLNTNHCYPVRILKGDEKTDISVENVCAVDGNDMDAAAQAIADCDIMATAVGVKILKFIIPNMVEGIRRRMKAGNKPLNIIICENLNDANKILEAMLKEQLNEEEIQWFDKYVGLVEASIGRMVPIQTPEMQDGEPMRVCVETYGFLPVDKAAFKGEVPEIKNMFPFEPFDYFIKRKLFVHNMGHATCAYLGGFTGKEYIWQSIADADTYIIVQNAMEASALALSKKYGVNVEDIFRHIQDLLVRFTNAALGDTCDRVGREPERKLSADDRLVGSYKLCKEVGVDPTFITVGMAGALYRYLTENNMEQTAENAAKVLMELGGIQCAQAIGYYEMLLSGKTIAEVRVQAELDRHAGLKDIV